VIWQFSIFHLRQKSLARGLLLAFTALAATLLLAGFPAPDAPHASNGQALVAPVACWAFVETFRCLAARWSLYHAGVLLLLYSELMILALVLFLWIYP